MEIYLVTKYWRGSLHIKPMRAFYDREEAIAYAKTLNESARFTRVYELELDCDYEPELITDRE